MKIKLISIGKIDRDWLRHGMVLYLGRLRHYITFEYMDIPDLKNASALSKEMIKEKEGAVILSKIAPTDYVILLDERGKELTSIELAGKLENRISLFNTDIIFVTGGAYGFAEAVYRRGNEKLSLSKLTFSHQMVRVIFAEQLYRAFTIIRGEPYHHE